MPLLTTPARSDHRPDRPANAMGTAAVMAASMAPAESRFCAPVQIRTSDTTAIPAATTPSHPTGVNVGVARYFGRAVATSDSTPLMPILPLVPRGMMALCVHDSLAG